MTKRILILEDHEDNRRIMRDLLTHAGYDVIEAVSGDEGVRMARTHLPDVVLVDVQLPGLDGHEATRRIKADPALQHVAVIAVTSYAMSGDEEKAREAGCDEYLAKPVNTRELLAKVRKYTS